MMLRFVLAALAASSIACFCSAARAAAGYYPPVHFEQNQECQSPEDALRLKLPSDYFPGETLRAITNCRRLNFNFLASDMSLTKLAYYLDPGSFYVNRFANGALYEDAIVHVSDVQPASAIDDRTLTTNRSLMFFFHDLLDERLRAAGRSGPGPYGLDVIDYPKRYSNLYIFYSVRQNQSYDGIIRCNLHRRQVCNALMYSSPDKIALGLTIPHAEIARLDELFQSSLTLVRKWRQN